MTQRSEDFVPMAEAAAGENIVLREELQVWKGNYELIQERLVELELALEDEGWRRIGYEGEREFTREGLKKIISLSRIMYLKNPLIQRAVEIHSFYVWGQSIEVQARSEDANAFIQKFIDDKGNRRELFSHASSISKDKKLQIEGNLFFVLFTSRLSGNVKLRSIPVDEVIDVIRDPHDRNVVWFYVREWTQRTFNMSTGAYVDKVMKAYYPDLYYVPKSKPKKVGSDEVRWDSPVYHVSVGGLDDMKFGVPETYAALDWARAYKNYLEDWASLVRAISRFAWKVSSKGKRVASIRDALNTTVGDNEDGSERNPAPLAGSTFIQGEDVDLTPINKSGATTSAADGKMLRLMVSSAMHLPDTILSNDPQQGALATAKTLDRPTELVMLDRQTLWIDVITDILNYVLVQAVKGTSSLNGKILSDDSGREYIDLGPVTDDDGNEVSNPSSIDITFPPILEDDLEGRIKAIALAMTLDGKPVANVAPIDVFRRLMLSALGVDDIDEILKQMTEDDAEMDDEERQPVLGAAPADVEEAMTGFVAALKNARQVMADG